MRSSNERSHPTLTQRLFAVWYRHVIVYGKNLVSNGLPPFLEPLIFLAGVGLGLSKYIGLMDNMPYLQFLGTGLLVTTAMFTASFECSFATFIRLEFEKVYDGMLAAPISVNNLLIGEILWAGTKGLFFSFAVLCIMTAFGIIPLPYSLLAPLVGFVTGVMFATLSLLVTSFVKTINHFNFYFTGFVSPMFFFSGVVFPIENLPAAIRPFAQALPLTHVVKLVRGITMAEYKPALVWSVLYCIIFILITGHFAIKRLRRRLIG
jgi:lipooligosaccharide transport system permease protein